LIFGELNGAQLFTLNKGDFEQICGRDEGIRLASQIEVQKSISSYRDDNAGIDELSKILQKRRQKSEV
jgi:hypothetical protein